MYSTIRRLNCLIFRNSAEYSSCLQTMRQACFAAFPFCDVVFSLPSIVIEDACCCLVWPTQCACACLSKQSGLEVFFVVCKLQRMLQDKFLSAVVEDCQCCVHCLSVSGVWQLFKWGLLAISCPGHRAYFKTVLSKPVAWEAGVSNGCADVLLSQQSRLVPGTHQTEPLRSEVCTVGHVDS